MSSPSSDRRDSLNISEWMSLNAFAPSLSSAFIEEGFDSLRDILELIQTEPDEFKRIVPQVGQRAKLSRLLRELFTDATVATPGSLPPTAKTTPTEAAVITTPEAQITPNSAVSPQVTAQSQEKVQQSEDACIGMMPEEGSGPLRGTSTKEFHSSDAGRDADGSQLAFPSSPLINEDGTENNEKRAADDVTKGGGTTAHVGDVATRVDVAGMKATETCETKGALELASADEADRREENYRPSVALGDKDLTVKEAARDMREGGGEEYDTNTNEGEGGGDGEEEVGARPPIMRCSTVEAMPQVASVLGLDNESFAAARSRLAAGDRSVKIENILKSHVDALQLSTKNDGDILEPTTQSRLSEPSERKEKIASSTSPSPSRSFPSSLSLPPPPIVRLTEATRWLKECRLEAYAHALQNEGFDEIDDLVGLAFRSSNAQLFASLVPRAGHREKMTRLLTAYHQQLQQQHTCDYNSNNNANSNNNNNITNKNPTATGSSSGVLINNAPVPSIAALPVIVHSHISSNRPQLPRPQHHHFRDPTDGGGAASSSIYSSASPIILDDGGARVGGEGTLSLVGEGEGDVETDGVVGRGGRAREWLSNLPQQQDPPPTGTSSEVELSSTSNIGGANNINNQYAALSVHSDGSRGGYAVFGGDSPSVKGECFGELGREGSSSPSPSANAISPSEAILAAISSASARQVEATTSTAMSNANSQANNNNNGNFTTNKRSAATLVPTANSGVITANATATSLSFVDPAVANVVVSTAQPAPSSPSPPTSTGGGGGGSNILDLFQNATVVSSASNNPTIVGGKSSVFRGVGSTPATLPSSTTSGRVESFFQKSVGGGGEAVRRTIMVRDRNYDSFLFATSRGLQDALAGTNKNPLICDDRQCNRDYVNYVTRNHRSLFAGEGGGGGSGATAGRGYAHEVPCIRSCPRLHFCFIRVLFEGRTLLWSSRWLKEVTRGTQDVFNDKRNREMVCLDGSRCELGKDCKMLHMAIPLNGRDTHLGDISYSVALEHLMREQWIENVTVTSPSTLALTTRSHQPNLADAGGSGIAGDCYYTGDDDADDALYGERGNANNRTRRQNAPADSEGKGGGGGRNKNNNNNNNTSGAARHLPAFQFNSKQATTASCDNFFNFSLCPYGPRCFHLHMNFEGAPKKFAAIMSKKQQELSQHLNGQYHLEDDKFELSREALNGVTPNLGDKLNVARRLSLGEVCDVVLGSRCGGCRQHLVRVLIELRSRKPMNVMGVIARRQADCLFKMYRKKDNPNGGGLLLSPPATNYNQQQQNQQFGRHINVPVGADSELEDMVWNANAYLRKEERRELSGVIAEDSPLLLTFEAYVAAVLDAPPITPRPLDLIGNAHNIYPEIPVFWDLENILVCSKQDLSIFVDCLTSMLVVDGVAADRSKIRIKAFATQSIFHNIADFLRDLQVEMCLASDKKAEEVDRMIEKAIRDQVLSPARGAQTPAFVLISSDKDYLSLADEARGQYGKQVFIVHDAEAGSDHHKTLTNHCTKCFSLAEVYLSPFTRSEPTMKVSLQMQQQNNAGGASTTPGSLNNNNTISNNAFNQQSPSPSPYMYPPVTAANFATTSKSNTTAAVSNNNNSGNSENRHYTHRGGSAVAGDVSYRRSPHSRQAVSPPLTPSSMTSTTNTIDVAPVGIPLLPNGEPSVTALFAKAKRAPPSSTSSLPMTAAAAANNNNTNVVADVMGMTPASSGAKSTPSPSSSQQHQHNQVSNQTNSKKPKQPSPSLTSSSYAAPASATAHLGGIGTTPPVAENTFAAGRVTPDAISNNNNTNRISPMAAVAKERGGQRRSPARGAQYAATAQTAVQTAYTSIPNNNNNNTNNHPQAKEALKTLPHPKVQTPGGVRSSTSPTTHRYNGNINNNTNNTKTNDHNGSNNGNNTRRSPAQQQQQQQQSSRSPQKRVAAYRPESPSAIAQPTTNSANPTAAAATSESVLRFFSGSKKTEQTQPTASPTTAPSATPTATSVTTTPTPSVAPVSTGSGNASQTPFSSQTSTFTSGTTGTTGRLSSIEAMLSKLVTGGSRPAGGQSPARTQHSQQTHHQSKYDGHPSGGQHRSPSPLVIALASQANTTCNDNTYRRSRVARVDDDEDEEEEDAPEFCAQSSSEETHTTTTTTGACIGGLGYSGGDDEEEEGTEGGGRRVEEEKTTDDVSSSTANNDFERQNKNGRGTHREEGGNGGGDYNWW